MAHIKVRIKNFSPTPKALIGAKTGVSYNYRKDGDVILMWKQDVDAAADRFDVLS